MNTNISKEKLTSIGECLFNQQGMALEKTGNINSKCIGFISDISEKVKNILGNEENNVIEIQFEKSVLLIKNDNESNLTAAMFGEIKKIVV